MHICTVTIALYRIILFYSFSPLSLNRLFLSLLLISSMSRKKKKTLPSTTATQRPPPKPIHYNIIKIQTQSTQKKKKKSKHNQPKINGNQLKPIQIQLKSTKTNLQQKMQQQTHLENPNQPKTQDVAAMEDWVECLLLP